MLLLLFLLVYINIGMGMILMSFILNKEDYLNSLLGENTPLILLFLWPTVIKRIYEDNWN